MSGVEAFFLAKGIVGMVGVLLLIFHMNRSWQTFDPAGTIGQRLRYLTLLYFAVFITALSYTQLKSAVGGLEPWNFGGFLGVILLVFTALVSIAEARIFRRGN